MALTDLAIRHCECARRETDNRGEVLYIVCENQKNNSECQVDPPHQTCLASSPQVDAAAVVDCDTVSVQAARRFKELVPAASTVRLEARHDDPPGKVCPNDERRAGSAEVHSPDCPWSWNGRRSRSEKGGRLDSSSFAGQMLRTIGDFERRVKVVGCVHRQRRRVGVAGR